MRFKQVLIVYQTRDRCVPKGMAFISSVVTFSEKAYEYIYFFSVAISRKSSVITSSTLIDTPWWASPVTAHVIQLPQVIFR